eukprot:5982361-Heterocapsa_arctica.AAC.1
MSDKPDDRKELSKFGAVRLPREQALDIIKTHEALDDYFIIVGEINIKGKDKVGYLFYQDMGNQSYA